MTRLCIINVVGLTPRLLGHAPHLAALGSAAAFRSPIPAVTCTSQATMLTGKMPRDHGVVGNGWYFRDTQEVRFWQQASALMSGQRFYEGHDTAKLFWWFNQSAPVKWSVTPKPHYGSDGSKVFDVIDETGCNLTERLGPFPFFSFWGPGAGLASSAWIADAASLVLEQNRPEITLVYLPHLDYDFQRLPVHDPARVAEVDQCAARIIKAASNQGIQVIAVSEYGLVPVSRAVHINRVLREHGWLSVRNGPFGEMLMPGTSKAFAVADHQVAHVYVNDARLQDDVRLALSQVTGIADVVHPADLALDHPRSGEWIALAEPDAWFTYYYWLDDAQAPDFARTVDIHRKPGYDPCELFMTSKPRAMWRLAQKKLGMRYRMDVIPLDASLVKGSHGLHPDPLDGPVVVGPEPPNSMVDFFAYVQRLLGRTD